MKFTKTRKATIIGVKNGFKFTLAPTNTDNWYVVVFHKKKDIRFNTLWSGLEFKTLALAKSFCEKFNYTHYECIGDDV